MGDKQSKHAGHESPQPKYTPKAEESATATGSDDASGAATASPPAAEPKRYDVIIASAGVQEDLSLAQLINDKVENAGLACFMSQSKSSRKIADLILEAHCVVFLASDAAATDGDGQDHISLAYVSNKTILVASRKSKDELLQGKLFNTGMKMTLKMVSWSLFESKEEDDKNVLTLLEKIQASITTKPEQETPEVPVGTLGRRGARLNTKLKAQSTARDIGGDNLMIENFWDRNFESAEEVPWTKFEEAFKKDYESQLSGLFEAENIPWLMEMLKSDVFDNSEVITKTTFFEVRGDSVERNAFWKVVSQIAVEKFNMREVFDMNSSVRLTTIEKLAKFQNPAVIEALLKLLEDKDPNVRAVAAISLGRTGTSSEYVIDCLIKLLEDKDRIVRQSACLSLGTMKAVKAVPHIGNIWRNDFISVVRNAARTALENMKIPEAKEVLSVTKVLEDEIAALEGSQAIV